MYWPSKLKRLFGLDGEPELPASFAESDGAERVKTALSRNPAVHGDDHIVDQLREDGEIVFFRRGDTIIREGEQGTDVYFLLAGSVDVVFKRQNGTIREAPNQVGEMAAIDPGRARSATIVARTKEVAALKISGKTFSDICSNFPEFQKLLNVEMGARHRERILAGQVAKEANSVWWFVISLGAGFVGGLVGWLAGAGFGWPASWQVALTAFGGLAVFVLMLLHNPAFFWRRCVGVALFAMIGTWALGQYVLVDMSQGLSSLEIAIGSCDETNSLASKVEYALPFLAAMLICGFFGHLERKT